MQKSIKNFALVRQISQKSFIGNKIISIIKNTAFEGQDKNDLTVKSFMEGFDNQTFRSIVLGSSGRLTKDLGERILKIVNSELVEAIPEIKNLVKEFREITK